MYFYFSLAHQTNPRFSTLHMYEKKIFLYEKAGSGLACKASYFPLVAFVSTVFPFKGVRER